MDNVLVTGANGFVGSALCQRLSDMGVRVVGLVKDRNYKSRRDVLEKISVVHGDLRDFDTVRYAMSHYEIDTVFHLGAVTILKVSVKDPLTCYQINVMGTANLLEAARQTGVKKVVVASSDKAYGTYENLPYKETYAVQSSPDPYSTSKACTDLIAQSYGKDEYGLDVSILRAGNIYGPGDLNMSRLMPRSILRCFDDNPPQIYNGVHLFKREFMYIDDVIDAYLTVCEKGERGGAYNVGGAGYQTIGDTANKIVELTGCTKEPEIVGKDFLEIEEQYLDPTKLEALGWKCKYKIDEGLKKAVEWYRKYYMEKKEMFYVA
jgi:CDP-glucose 4,6-dehydratase